MTEETPPPEELVKIDYIPPKKDWMDPKTEFKRGCFSYAAKLRDQKIMELPNPREWHPLDEDWKLPENWKEIVLNGMKDRLEKYRSFKLFMDICVRCGACADKCHYYIGSGDPKNMPVLRAELLRSVYRRYFTTAGKLFGKVAGARDLTYDTIKEWYYYFYQCSECRRCSVFCPYGIDTCEVTMMARELLDDVGISTYFIMEPTAHCHHIGNHLGLPPAALVNTFRSAADDIKDITGVDVEVPINKKGAEILVIPPSGDYFATPHWYTFMGYLMLFHEIGLDYTWSAYAAEGGNFGFFHSIKSAQKLNAKIYAEAKRLGVKWILGCECGHMWRVVHQYMDTMNGPADFLEEPVSPITGTKFENAASTKMVHICEFTADLIKHNKIKLDPNRNKRYKVTFHDSCNPARALGLFEEPRYILKNVLPDGHFIEMPENTIREKTFCCGSGAGILADEMMEMRMRGGMPRALAAKYVAEKFGVNMLCCICAIDRAALPHLMEYWKVPVEVCGLHELVGNALIMKGEKERTENLRGEPLYEEEEEEKGGEE